MILPDLPEPTLRLHIDSDALAHNWRALDRLSGGARTGAAVKADAYGTGIEAALPALLKAGAQDFFVAHWSEVPALLQHVAPENVSVLHGVMTAGEAAFAKQTGVKPVLNSMRQIALWQEAGGGAAHLMVDTGMNRLGLEPGLVGDPLVSALEVDTLMSHLASADEDCAQNAEQLTRFQSLASQVPARSRSLANSAGIALGADYHFDLTRPGLALYGGIPRPEIADKIRPVVAIEAMVLQLRELSAGDKVGYNATFTAPRDMRAATVSLGYADGFLRSWANSGKTQFNFQGEALPLLGRVSMDMIVLDCSSAPDIAPGDFVQLPYDLPSAAELSGLSQYELLTLLGSRYGRENVVK